MNEMIEKLAGEMYDAYCDAVGGLAFNGYPLPAWSEFGSDPSKQKQANGWRVAAKIAIGIPDMGFATKAAKAGKRVARAGWNGSGMFAYIVPAASYPAQTGAAKAHFGENGMVPYREYWALKTAQGDIATWAPSGSDSLAEDWMVLD